MKQTARPLRRRLVHVAACIAVIGVAAAACGSDDDTSAPADSTDQTSEPGDGTAPTEPPEATNSPPDSVPATTEPVSVQFGDIFGYFQGIYPVIADKQGYFENHGLDVEFVPIESGPALATALISDSVDIAIEATSIIWPLRHDGEELVALVGNIRSNFALFAQADLELPNAGSEFPGPIEDLRGGTVGVTALGSQQEAFVVALLEAAGMSADDVTFVAVGAPATAVPAFLEDQVDFLAAPPPMLQQLEAAGAEFTVVVDEIAGTAGDHSKNQLLNEYTTTQTFIDENPEAALGFCKALADARAFAADDANLDEVGVILGEWLNLDPEIAKDVWLTSRDSFLPIITEEIWEAQGAFAPPDIAGFVPDYEQFVYAPCQEL